MDSWCSWSIMRGLWYRWTLWFVILGDEYVMGKGWRLIGTYGLCMSFALGFSLRDVHYVLMRSYADYAFLSRWRLLLMVTQICEFPLLKMMTRSKHRLGVGMAKGWRRLISGLAYEREVRETSFLILIERFGRLLQYSHDAVRLLLLPWCRELMWLVIFVCD